MLDWKDAQMLANAEQQKLNVDRIGRARDQAREANGRADDYRALYKDISDSNDELHERNYALEQQVGALQSKITEQEKTILRQKELLREWMVSQIAFKNLFKKYGKMPDGRGTAEMTDEEKAKLIQEEEETAIKANQKLAK